MPDETHPAVAYELLDGDAWALQRMLDEALVPLAVLDAEGVRSLPLFRAEEAASRHRDALPAEVRDAYAVVALPGSDPRGKEEFLRAAASLGAVTIDVDPDLSLHARGRMPLATAISYVTSFRRESACL